MADVDVRGHDGDGHGDPPPGGRNPASGCAAVGPPNKRRMTTNKGLRKRWEKNGCQPFPIVFDFEDQQTMRPVGPYSRDFVNLLGVTIRTTVPLTYNSWRDVPDEATTAIWPQLETYFNLSPYLDHPGYKTPFETGIMKPCAELYSGAKSRFKKIFFTKHGGHDKIDVIRQRCPAGMTPEKWNAMVNSYSSEDNVRRSAVNSTNRSHHRYKSYHGTRSFCGSGNEATSSAGPNFKLARVELNAPQYNAVSVAEPSIWTTHVGLFLEWLGTLEFTDDEFPDVVIAEGLREVLKSLLILHITTPNFIMTRCFLPQMGAKMRFIKIIAFLLLQQRAIYLMRRQWLNHFISLLFLCQLYVQLSFQESNQSTMREKRTLRHQQRHQPKKNPSGSSRGFKRSRGHIVPGMTRYHASSSSPGPCTPPPPVYT